MAENEEIEVFVIDKTMNRDNQLTISIGRGAFVRVLAEKCADMTGRKVADYDFSENLYLKLGKPDELHLNPDLTLEDHGIKSKTEIFAKDAEESYRDSIHRINELQELYLSLLPIREDSKSKA